MNIVEKVAKAIYEHGYVGDWPPKHEVDLNMDADYFRAAARAAIEAMREPPAEVAAKTAEMNNLIAHIEGCNDERDTVPILLAFRGRWPALTWSAMIDAALSEK